MTSDRHAFHPTVPGAILEKRVLPAPLATVQFSMPKGPSGAPSNSPIRGLAINFSTISSSVVTTGTSGYNGNAGLGTGFSYSTRSFYGLNAGLGIGYSLSAGSRGTGSSTTLSIFGGPGLNPYGPGVGPGLQTGPEAGGSGGTGGVSPPTEPGGPPPGQATPDPSGQPATPQGQGILPPRQAPVSPAELPLPTTMPTGPTLPTTMPTGLTLPTTMPTGSTNPLAKGVETGSPATSRTR